MNHLIIVCLFRSSLEIPEINAMVLNPRVSPHLTPVCLKVPLPGVKKRPVKAETNNMAVSLPKCSSTNVSWAIPSELMG